MQAQIKSWGNSQGIRLSKEMLQMAEMTLDDVLNVEVSGGRIVLSKPVRHLTLEERAEPFGGKLNLDGEYDWGEPADGEYW